MNVIHYDCRMRSNNSKSVCLNGLISNIDDYIKIYPSYKFILFVDGEKVVNNIANLSIDLIFSGKNSADDYIKKYIENNSFKQLTVVSTDTEVYNFAKIHGVTVLTSESFLNKIKNSSKQSIRKTYKNKSIIKEKPFGISKKEINEYMKIFEEASN